MKTYAIYVGMQRLITGYVDIESNNIYTLVKGYKFTPAQMKETQTIIIGSMKGKELNMNWFKYVLTWFLSNLILLS